MRCGIGGDRTGDPKRIDDQGTKSGSDVRDEGHADALADLALKAFFGALAIERVGGHETRSAPDATCKLREVAIVPLICPTSQSKFSVIQNRSSRYCAWGCFRDFLAGVLPGGSEPSTAPHSPAGFGETASPYWPNGDWTAGGLPAFAAIL
jgi:hypothetical protein